MKEAKDKPLHICGICGHSFSNNYNLRKHTRSHTGEKPFFCTICGLSYTQSGGLKNHIVSIHGTDRNFICYYCGKQFPIKERLKLHVMTHTGEKPYKCSECSKRFGRRSLLSQHLRTHSNVRPYTCDTCDMNFVSRSNLLNHIKRHSGERDHICPKCGKGFSRGDGLRKHLIGYHSNHKEFECKICNKRFKGHLLQHMRIHKQDKPHACQYCEKTFIQRSQLTVHERTHTGTKAYKCPVCDTTFSQSTALKIHIRRHTGEKPFKCSICLDKSFSQLPHLKKHLLTIHKTNKPYICPGCNTDFCTKNELQDHSEKCDFKIEENDVPDAVNNNAKITLEKIRLLVAVLLQKRLTSKKLIKVGYGKRLIDLVLIDSIAESGSDPCTDKSLSDMDRLQKNVRILLKWTVPKKWIENFKKENSTMDVLFEEFAF